MPSSSPRHRLALLRFRIRHMRRRAWTCPVCSYHGPFRDLDRATGYRSHARCPNCGALERHRLQMLVLGKLANRHCFDQMDMLHLAPEVFFREWMAPRFHRYVTADLSGRDVDVRADVTGLPFRDGEFDIVFASHVLEHVTDDAAAIAQIRRVLKPGGLACLPVPVVAEETIEYSEPHARESGHVRAPGRDYFERYEKCFMCVDVYSSADFPEVYQTYLHEDRAAWPLPGMPLLRPMSGDRHPTFMPVCTA